MITQNRQRRGIAPIYQALTAQTKGWGNSLIEPLTADASDRVLHSCPTPKKSELIELITEAVQIEDKHARTSPSH